MTSGVPITEAERWQVLRMHYSEQPTAAICRKVRLDYRTVRHIIDEAARRWFEVSRHQAVDWRDPD